VSPATYNATRCNWQGQTVRPRFVGFEENAAPCVASYAEHSSPWVPSTSLTGRGASSGASSATHAASSDSCGAATHSTAWKWVLAAVLGCAVGVVAGASFTYNHNGRKSQLLA